ncbi:TIGR01777 family oxidoreductase [Evansella sp. LMS18]|jgi:uncharacterized protein (TIGR01777 family)|uniref:TIGR01777 family oxidoreductase n=1 Tax=Evansella sp. LMS18 TaxID=2924033 RepID=UPI0034E94F85
MMNIAVAGGAGFIGRSLTERLAEQGHELYILTRNPNNKPPKKQVTYVEWLGQNSSPEKSLSEIDAFINLAGESLNSRWTDRKKSEILNSRVESTKEMVRIIEALDSKPKVFINASATGYYGTSYHHTFTETSPLSGDDFLSAVVKKWEQEASAAMPMTRVVYSRFGMVLDSNDGALQRMLLPFKLFAGGRLGTGEQWISWIHIEDAVSALIHCLETPSISGPVNFTAPQPVLMEEFGRTAADVLKRPYYFPVPSNILELALGEMAVLVTQGQKAVPVKLSENDFQFLYPELKPALENLLSISPVSFKS